MTQNQWPGVYHQLFIQATPSSTIERRLSHQALNLIASNKEGLARIGIKVHVNKVQSSALTNDVIKAFEKHKVNALPALITPMDSYVGWDKITTAYKQVLDTNQVRSKAINSMGAIADEPEDELDSYNEAEIKRNDQENDSDAIGDESKTMMEEYQKKMDARGDRNKNNGPMATPANTPRRDTGQDPKTSMLLEDSSAPYTADENSAQDDQLSAIYWTKHQTSI